MRCMVLDIQKEINETELNDKHTLIETLDKAMQNLRKNDYEDNNSKTYHLLTELVKAFEDQKSKTDRPTKIVKSVEAFMAILD